ncbi:6-pyruvoyl-tetrahydropterin synthase [Azotobacter vinelandii CA]|uniref:6-carboxy-5,6,7,8-tetrahydropterin synthase n=2 Tax=Azotobacter vinelandii TaxID=354 RepID=C1DM00_AZOVD|nr:6-carboxytetrahydropterin synthase [Azotobacter vinelandii]ACO79087.1 6-pyruvoyl-tetrahydropterin synthase [Azotobacter vinelandii DJ]AGK16503.1 6-pyruvoyl-tetrahydropterin synthase [Azotobacter vinelandii CA]AGK20956.1 6-pyruvoyl-tetrahydropterin synthase [Azotobacter vinelandii CA6]WKN20066.1 6-carboxytetrahydropterin synthase [Azotobacter vinelandii]SFX51203.1 6-pyruvoyltetrahydropterin/6-carboxytetrahydropterin synthase [Azotobacter vinelandii]
MLIRKLFKFESAHIVRHCTTRRCSRSLHGHSYRVEVLIEADALDRGQMVYDFALLKGAVADFIDAFDHAVVFWSGDDPAYIEQCKRFSERWVMLPVSPSAEQLSRVFFRLIDAVLANTEMVNGESGVRLYSVIVHETDTGYAQCFREDAGNPRMGIIRLEEIGFSARVEEDWANPRMFAELLAREPFVNRSPGS